MSTHTHTYTLSRSLSPSGLRSFTSNQPYKGITMTDIDFIEKYDETKAWVLSDYAYNKDKKDRTQPWKVVKYSDLRKVWSITKFVGSNEDY